MNHHPVLSYYFISVISTNFGKNLFGAYDKNRSMGKTGGKNLQTMKKIVLSVLNIVKSSYHLSMKRIRYEMSLDYEGEVEKLLSMLDEESIKKALESAENRRKKPV